jgi:hypothetical protein
MYTYKKLLSERSKLDQMILNSTCLYSSKILKQSQEVDKLIVLAMKEKLAALIK